MSSHDSRAGSGTFADSQGNGFGMLRNVSLIVAIALIAWSYFNPATDTHPQSLSAPSRHVAHQTSNAASININKITVGQRVTALNPQRSDEDRAHFNEPQQNGWQLIEMVRIDDASLMTRVTLLRPNEWFTQEEVKELGRVTLSMPEIGADGEFLVTAIKPCPPIEPGLGSVVTGTFAHQTRDPILAVHVEGIDEPITATANHPFWSETDQAFVEVGHMSPGDIVRTADGQLRRLTSIEPRAGPTTPLWVYNLEVAGEHVYHVGQAGVTVHNNKAAPTSGRRSNFRQRGFALNPRSHNFRNYRKTFFDANPELKGKVVVHHRVEQIVIHKYPGHFTAKEIHALNNLRGIPKSVNSEVHLSAVRKSWNGFYKQYPNATKQQILAHAKKIDKMLDGMID